MGRRPLARFRRIWRPAAGFSFLIAIASPVFAQQDSIDVHRLTLVGVDSIDADRLKSVLATRQSSRLPWGRKETFDRTRFEADLQRITAFYADRGFPDARVTSFDIQPNPEQTAVDVTIVVDEGEPVVVSSLEFIGFDGVPQAHRDRLRDDSPIRPGRPLDRQLAVQAIDVAVNELQDHGFPYARVSMDEGVSPGSRQARVVIKADPGPLAYFGPIEIIGNSSVSTRVIERQLQYRRGDLYRRSSVQSSQRRLYGMELFQFVNVQPLDLEGRASEVWTRVTVVEGNHQRLNFGVGYGTEEKARVEGEYRHVNFLGGARSAGTHARWSSLDRGLRIDFNQPYFLHPALSLGFEGQQWRTTTPAYESIVTGGRTTLTRQSAGLTLNGSFIAEYTSSAVSADALNDPSLRDELIALGLDPTSGRQEGSLSAIGFDMQRSTADNLLNATRGYQIAVHLEQAGRVLPGTFNYASVSTDLRHYLSLDSRTVLASRLQLGTIDAAGDRSNVPFSKKYFLGGATTIRGWGRYQISPLSGSGLPIGGNSLLAFSLEGRRGLSGRLGGVLFLDGGNVWANEWTINLHEILYAAGVGLRYQTPVGPVRVDLGYQLNQMDNLVIDGLETTRRWRIHFSIGQAF